jgi:hypothetical protein
VIFERLDCPFGSVTAIHGGRRQLELDVMLVNELAEGRGTFIVEALQSWFKTMINKFLDELVVGPDHFLVASALHRLCEDVVSVIII